MRNSPSQELMDQIAALLRDAGMVLAGDADNPDSGLALTLRKSAPDDPEPAFDVFGRYVYAKSAHEATALNDQEQAAMDAWASYWIAQQEQIFPRPEIAHLPRLDGVQLRTRWAVYDGPLTGLCTHEGRWAHFAVFEQYENGLRPQTFCLWYFDAQEATVAQSQYLALADSYWAHLNYNEEGQPMKSMPGDDAWPEASDKAILAQRAQSDRAWISSVAQGKLENPQSPHPAPSGVARTPDGWFTYADSNLIHSSRDDELTGRIDLCRKSLIEGWDAGYRIQLPSE